jgi:hypothetical protein
MSSRAQLKGKADLAFKSPPPSLKLLPVAVTVALTPAFDTLG